MDRISELSDELLVKILSFLPTKVAVSTSILSKHWEFLWMWLPKLEYNDSDIKGPASSAIRYRDFIDKNLPLHRGPVIESLLLSFYRDELLQPESIKRWVEIAVSRCVRELSISFSWYNDDPPDLSLPSSLYTCNSLTTLKLEGKKIFVDVPRTVCLPSLKTLLLRCVTYLNEDSLQLLLSYCPVLEDLLIERAEQNDESPYVSLPSSLYTCNSLTTLKLEGKKILVDVPRTVCLPSLKTLQLRCVTYLNEDSLRLLLSYCPVLEDLLIERDGHDNVRALVVTFPSLQRLSLTIGNECSSGGYVIVTPSLKYFKFEDSRDTFSCLIEHMPKLEEADIDVVQDCEKRLESITSVRRLSLRAFVSLALDVTRFPFVNFKFSIALYRTLDLVFLRLKFLLLRCCRVCSLCLVLVLSSISLNILSYVYAPSIGQSFLSGCSGSLLNCNSSISASIIMQVLMSIIRLSGRICGRMNGGALFLNVCRRVSKLLSLQGTVEHKKREIS